MRGLSFRADPFGSDQGAALQNIYKRATLEEVTMDRNYAMLEGKKVLFPKNPHDKDICPFCKNNTLCLLPCLPIQWIDGNKARKEPLLKHPAEQQPSADYNQTISELIEDKAARNDERIEAIRAIEQPRRRLVCAGILVGMTQKQISQQAHISQGRISRIYQGLTKA